MKRRDFVTTTAMTTGLGLGLASVAGAADSSVGRELYVLNRFRFATAAKRDAYAAFLQQVAWETVQEYRAEQGTPWRTE